MGMIDKIINTNKIFGGSLKDKNDLEYAIERAEREKNRFRKLAYLVRAFTSNHVFWEGNKRTAITIVLSEFSDMGLKYDRKRLINSILKLAESGEGDINKIEKILRKCSKK